MSKVTKKILIDDKEVEVTFYQELTRKRLTRFLADVEHFYAVSEGLTDLYTQQFMHSLLVIKHFTDYNIKAETVEDFLKEGQVFTKPGVLEGFAKTFDVKFINDVNQTVVMHFLTFHGDIPEYLNFGSNITNIEKMKEQIKKYNMNDIDEDDFWNDEDDDEDDDWNVEWEPEIKTTEPEKPKLKKKLDFSFYQEAVQHSINKLLDEYNDYLELYQAFGDDKYLLRASHIMRVLKGEEAYNEDSI